MMKTYLKLMFAGACALALPILSSCSDDDNNPDLIEYETIGFSQVSGDLIGGPTFYGNNLYYGDAAQITKGYLAYIGNETYMQFPVNYAEQPWIEGQPWQYTFFNGGMAVSNWHDMTVATYENQLSVYNTTSPSGGNFVVSFGNSSQTDPNSASYSDYDGCGHIYITDINGYGVDKLGDKTPVKGVAKTARFNSVKLANTTYPYLVMKNGNDYASALNDSNRGWFKVQFIAFNSTDASAKPIGFVEAYLANFDEALMIQAGFVGEISQQWTTVDLSSLPAASVLVINFVGSDTGEYGLNTPSYCALDQFVVEDWD